MNATKFSNGCSKQRERASADTAERNNERSSGINKSYKTNKKVGSEKRDRANVQKKRDRTQTNLIVYVNRCLKQREFA
jgi:hypothetical protein